MSGIWIKVCDLWDYKIRTTLAVLSIAAGVFAVGAHCARPQRHAH